MIKRGLLHVCIFWAACIHLIPASLQGRTAAEVLEWRMAAGQIYEYQVEYHSISDTDFRALFEEPADSSGEVRKTTQSGMVQSHATSLRGLWTITVLENAGAPIVISCTLVDPAVSLVLNGSEAQDLAGKTAGELGLEFFSEMNAQGRILSVYFDPQADDLARHCARTLLAKSQFVLPAEPTTGDDTWKAEEEDLNGTCKTLYEPLSPLFMFQGKELHSDQKAFRKSRLIYFAGMTHPSAGRKTLQTTIKPEGSLRAVFNIHGGFLESIEGLEKEQISIAGKKVSDVESRFLLHLAKRDSISPEDLDEKRKDFEILKEKVDPIALSEPVSEETGMRAIQRSALGEETLESLLAELERAEAAGEERNTGLYLKFKALVFMHPECCKILGERLASADYNSLNRRILTLSLSINGHPEAQEALIAAIAARPQDPEFQAGLIQSLSMVNNPTEKAESLLRGFICNTDYEHLCYRTALEGLGLMSRNLMDSDTARSHAIVDWIIGRLDASDPIVQQVFFVSALGNSGSGRAMPVLSRCTVDSAFELRATAAAGLAWASSPAADTLLAEVLKSDPESFVRLQAVHSMSLRNPAPVSIEIQKKALLEDKSETVRLSVLRNLSAVMKKGTGIRTLIEKAAEKDPSEDIRKAAAQILE